MTKRVVLFVFILLALTSVLMGCRRLRSWRHHSKPREQHTVHPNGPTRLVVTIVLDQVGSHVLERLLPLLPEDGAIRSLIRRGVFHHRVVYPYAGTYTAPGHATIYTGQVPADHGVIANRIWSPIARKNLSVVDDGHYTVLGHPQAHASPELLRVETVADALKRQTRGKAHVVSVSMKDRGAVIPGGKHPDIALWYDEDAKGFTTSTWYTKTLPKWFVTWTAQHPTQDRFTVWTLSDPLLVQSLGGVDDAPGEGNWKEFGATFPHDLARAKEPYAAFLASPQGSELLLELAEKAAWEYHLGDDEIPDLLAISISGTDYVGHVFGPHSYEAADNLLRVDQALKHLLETLSARTSVAVLITADHGVSLLPEESAKQGILAVRIEPEDLVRVVDQAVDAQLGAGDWVDAFAQPYLVLSAAARAHPQRDRIVKIAVDTLTSQPGVAAAFDSRWIATQRESNVPLHVAVSMSVDAERAGDVFVVPANASIVDEQMPKGFGTSHGSPFPQDTQVPVIFAGEGIAHDETTILWDQRSVAATICAMLRIAPPTGLTAGALPSAPTATTNPNESSTVHP